MKELKNNLLKELRKITYINLVIVILVSILNLLEVKTILYGNIFLMFIILFFLYSIKSGNVTNGEKSIKKLSIMVSALIIVNTIVIIAILPVIIGSIALVLCETIMIIYLLYTIYITLKLYKKFIK